VPKERMHVTAPEAVAVEVAVLLLATNVYRAWTQSIGLDEARSYNMLSAARGYGLGLGLPMWAFTHLALYFEDQDEGRLFKAGSCRRLSWRTLAAGAIAARQWARSRLFAGFERADRASAAARRDDGAGVAHDCRRPPSGWGALSVGQDANLLGAADDAGGETVTIPKKWRFPIAVTALLAAMGVVMAMTAAGETQTWDEGIHLASGYSYLKTGDFKMNLEHPPLFKLLAGIPLLLLKPDLPLDREAWKNGWQIEFSRDFMDVNRVSPDQILRYGRIPNMLLTLLLGFAIAVWTRRRFGTAAALGALFLYATDPNAIAHGRYVTNDLIGDLVRVPGGDCVGEVSGAEAAAGPGGGGAVAGTGAGEQVLRAVPDSVGGAAVPVPMVAARRGGPCGEEAVVPEALPWFRWRCWRCSAPW